MRRCAVPREVEARVVPRHRRRRCARDREPGTRALGGVELLEGAGVGGGDGLFEGLGIEKEREREMSEKERRGRGGERASEGTLAAS